MKAAINALSARSSGPTWTASFPAALRMPVAVRSPTFVLRTAKVTEALALARARVVSARDPTRRR
ncbi:hypothetical protein ABT150_30920 [Streptomyces mirabilis]|uniref:hypothetical protein n=1 Tax=Streptomyces mirabilis TaxID=68239 RepID=UPI00332D7502